MSDPEVPKNEQPHDVDHVVGSANEGLDAAAAARDNVPGSEPAPVDPDMEAFAAAERDYPGTFGANDAAAHDAAAHDAAAHDAASSDADAPRESFAAPAATDAGAETPVLDADNAPAAADASTPTEVYAAGEHDAAHAAPAAADNTPTAAYDAPTAAYDAPTAAYDRDAAADRDAETVQYTPPSVADTAYGSAAAGAYDAPTQVVPAEPTAPVVPVAPQPIFVQAPEPPRELGNRGAAGGIGIVAAICFAILYMGAILGFGALNGDVTLENVGTEALAAVQTFSFWVPVVVFFLAFWLLGAFINRARWGKWVVLGLLVAAATYGGHLLGQLFQAPFWSISGAQSVELVNEQLLAPLAIAAFVFARELTIWFGAWVSRSGAKKKALNAEAHAEYERTLEAGPAAMHGA